MEKYFQIKSEIKEGMNFIVPGTKGKWIFIEFSFNEIVVETPEHEVITKPLSFLDNIILDIDFLDYTIVNSGNSDGWVITKDSSKPNYKSYECNLGNFSSLEDAKKYCVRFFMIARPVIFARSICNKTVRMGSGTWGEYHLLKRCLIDENIQIPNEILPSDDSNYMITVNGKKI